MPPRNARSCPVSSDGLPNQFAYRYLCAHASGGSFPDPVDRQESSQQYVLRSWCILQAFLHVEMCRYVNRALLRKLPTTAFQAIRTTLRVRSDHYSHYCIQVVFCLNCLACLLILANFFVAFHRSIRNNQYSSTGLRTGRLVRYRNQSAPGDLRQKSGNMYMEQTHNAELDRPERHARCGSSTLSRSLHAVDGGHNNGSRAYNAESYG